MRKMLRNLSNIPGWRTNRKIVVIESDDWGSIRMPSRQTFEKLKSAGLNLDRGNFARQNLNDTLASVEDFTALFEVLSSWRDKNNRHPVFTAASLVANPDFEKIKLSNYSQYYYEPFSYTLERYGKKKALAYWGEGIEKGLFVPQFHGREHLNVPAWMRALQRKDEQTLLAFHHGFWGFKNKHPNNLKYQAAFDLEIEADLNFHSKAIEEGLILFQQLHGFSASFFVPPNGPFNNTLGEVAANFGIKYISISKIQKEPLGRGETRKVYHWLGQNNKYKQIYLTRNAFFEPNLEGRDWIKSCLSEISTAFQWRKPAIISTHRVNYIGGLNPSNRSYGLKQLKELLKEIIKTWPDVEFMTSVELGEVIGQAQMKY